MKKKKKVSKKVSGLRKTITLLICGIIILLVAAFILDKGYVPNKALKQKWIRIDEMKNYEVMEFTKNSFSYTYPKLGKTVGNYNLCEQYSYSKLNSIISLKCDKDFDGIKKFELIEVTNDYLKLEIDGDIFTYYNYIEGAVEEKMKKDNKWSDEDFEKYLKGDTSKFKIITYKDLVKLYKKNTTSVVVFGNNNETYNYVVSLERIAKMIDEYKDLTIYYVDTTKLTEEEFDELNKLNKDFESDSDYRKKVTPTVFIFKKSKMIDNFQVDCNYTTCSFDKALEKYGFTLK